MTPNLPVTLCLVAAPGRGKSYLLERYAKENPGELQLITPPEYGATLSASLVDWESHAVVAVDELSLWERKSLVEGLHAIEAACRKAGKRLVLTCLHEGDLERLGLSIQAVPMHLGNRRSEMLTYMNLLALRTFVRSEEADELLREA